MLSVNLSSFNFLKSWQPDKDQQFAVVGMGRFGRAVCATLHGMRYEVLGVDRDERLVNQALSDRIADRVICLDTTEPSALQEAGLFEFDIVIVAIGNYLAESIITTLNLKEGGVQHVVSKASSEVHVKLLKKVGADRVIFPEREMGCELARSLTRPRILDQFELDPDHSIVEIVVPEKFEGKTLAELDLRKSYGISVLAVGKENNFEINPNPQERLRKGLAMVVIGSNRDLDRLPL